MTVPIPKVKPELVPVKMINEKVVAFNETVVSTIFHKSSKPINPKTARQARRKMIPEQIKIL